MKRYIIKKLGGFPDVQSAIQYIKDMNDVSSKHKILTEAVKDLFNMISEEDVLRFRDGDWYFEGKPMVEAEYMQLKEDALLLLKMKLWKIIKKDIAYALNRKMFLESRVEQDLISGKLIYVLDDIIQKRLKRLAKS